MEHGRQPGTSPLILRLFQKSHLKKPSGYDIHSSPWKDPPFLRTVNHLLYLFLKLDMKPTIKGSQR
jgi:hypothetical protein